MTQSIRTQNEAAKQGISYEMLLCIIGWSLLQAATAAVTFSPAIRFGEINDAVSIGIDRGLLLCAIALTYIIDFALRPRWRNGAWGRILTLALLAQLPTLALTESVLHVSIPYLTARTSWILCGFGVGMVNAVWMESHLALDGEEFNRTSHWSLIAFTALLVGILVVPEPYTLAIILVMFLAGTIMPAQLTHSENCAAVAKPRHTALHASSDAEKHIMRNGSFVLLINGIAEGMVAALIVYRAASGVIQPIAIGICILATATIYITFRKLSPGLLSPERSQLLFHPILIVSLVCAGFVARPFNVIPAMIAFILFYLIDRVNYMTLIVRGFLLKDNPTSYFESHRIWIVIGLGLGWFVGAFVASDVGHGTFPYFALTLIALFCSHFSIIAIKPEWSPMMRGFVKESDVEKEKVSKWAGFDNGDSVDASTAKYDSSHYISGRFKCQCAKVAENAALTPRETEVLCFMAKGRNAKYIASQLYISERTVKTHGYHIYQKLGIHSQQELIDLVEKTEA